MSALNELLNSFEKDGDGWMYYGDADPKQAAAELEAMREVIEAARVMCFDFTITEKEAKKRLAAALAKLEVTK